MDLVEVFFACLALQSHREPGQSIARQFPVSARLRPRAVLGELGESIIFQLLTPCGTTDSIFVPVTQWEHMWVLRAQILVKSTCFVILFQLSQVMKPHLAPLWLSRLLVLVIDSKGELRPLLGQLWRVLRDNIIDLIKSSIEILLRVSHLRGFRSTFVFPCPISYSQLPRI